MTSTWQSRNVWTTSSVDSNGYAMSSAQLYSVSRSREGYTKSVLDDRYATFNLCKSDKGLAKAQNRTATNQTWAIISRCCFSCLKNPTVAFCKSSNLEGDQFFLAIGKVSLCNLMRERLIDQQRREAHDDSNARINQTRLFTIESQLRCAVHGVHKCRLIRRVVLASTKSCHPVIGNL